MSEKIKQLIEITKIANRNLNKKYLKNKTIIHILENLIVDIDNINKIFHKLHLTTKDLKTGELERHFVKSLDLITEHTVQMDNILLRINKIKQFVKRKSQSLEKISAALKNYEKVVEEDEEQDEEHEEEQEQEEQEEDEDEDNATIIVSDDDYTNDNDG